MKYQRSFSCARILRMQRHAPNIFTIGHSSISADNFLALLRLYRVDAVVDVRSHPASKFAPHFGRRQLSPLLRSANVRYAFMGDQLGGRPSNSQFYDEHGHVLYGEWSASKSFSDGLARLTRAAANHRLALMCSEESPRRCHRHLLIARALVNNGWPRSHIIHIRGDGLNTPEDAISVQSGPLMEGIGWKSPRSVSREPRPGTSSNA